MCIDVTAIFSMEISEATNWSQNQTIDIWFSTIYFMVTNWEQLRNKITVIIYQ